MYASCEGSDETVRTHILVRAFTASTCDKYQNGMSLVPIDILRFIKANVG